MAKGEGHEHTGRPHIMAAVPVDWDRRTDLREVVGNPLPNTLLAHINKQGFDIDPEPIRGWGKYTHTVTVDDLLIPDKDGYIKEMRSYTLHARLCPECGSATERVSIPADQRSDAATA